MKFSIFFCVVVWRNYLLFERLNKFVIFLSRSLWWKSQIFSINIRQNVWFSPHSFEEICVFFSYQFSNIHDFFLWSFAKISNIFCMRWNSHFFCMKVCWNSWLFFRNWLTKFTIFCAIFGEICNFFFRDCYTKLVIFFMTD